MAWAYGTCCSTTWIESLDLPSVLIGGTVKNVEDLGTQDKEEHGFKVTLHYGLKITTEKGSCVIDYRNLSNGYYRGALDWPGDRFYHDPQARDIPDEGWKSII